MATPPGTPLSGKKIRSIVNEIVSSIETNFKGFNVSEIIKGGSQGHGTGVDTSDIDLVVYSRDISEQKMFDQGKDKKEWLEMLHKFLCEQFGSHYKKTTYTHRALKFKFKDQIRVDLLVSQYFEFPEDFYKFQREFLEKNKEDEKRFSYLERFNVCASKWQVDFFQKLPPQVKEHIRIMKLWRDEEWSSLDKTSSKPSSYLISLLVIAAHRENPDNIYQGLIDLPLEQDTLDVTWSYCYKLEDVEDLLPDCPRIVDPANPTTNVLDRGFRLGWKKKKHELPRYMLSITARRRRKKYMHHPPELTASEAGQVRELASRCYTWSKKQWKDDDDDNEEGSGRPTKYLLFLIILKAFYDIQDEKNKRQLKRLKAFVHLVQRRLITMVDEIVTAKKDFNLELPIFSGIAKKKYKNQPSRPCICDPVNPTKNLYRTEIDSTQWPVLKERIQYIDLSTVG